MSFKCSRDRKKIMDDRKRSQGDKQGPDSINLAGAVRRLDFSLIEMESH